MPEEKKPISEGEVKEFAKLLISMSTDFLMTGINKATFIHNLRIMADTLAISAYPSMPTHYPRANLIENLEKVRKYVCSYVGATEKFCDCKYGANHIGNKGEEDGGCAELRYVIGLLGSMSDDEMSYFESRHRAKTAEHKEPGHG